MMELRKSAVSVEKKIGVQKQFALDRMKRVNAQEV